MPTIKTVLCVLLATTGGFAQEKSNPAPTAPEPATSPAATSPPAAEKLDETRYRIGNITFDKKTRQIRFPARVNMVEGFLEFLIVHENGKVHESLLATEVSPTELNLVFKLLRYPGSAELFPLPGKNGQPSNKYPIVPKEVKSAARISIDLEWTEAGKLRSIKANEWVRNSSKNATMTMDPWVYTGSVFEDGRFAAEFTGDIVAIFVAQSALINYPGSDNRDDTVWQVHTERVPAVDTDVNIVISPFSNDKKPSKP